MIKKILLFTIILMIAVSSLGIVSAGWFDFLGGNDEPVSPLINSSVVITANSPKASTEYAYFYEDSGEYSGAAYYRQWEVNSTFNFNVETLYENYLADGDSDYDNLDDYKQHLKDRINDGEIYLYNYGDFADKDGNEIETPMGGDGYSDDVTDINDTYLSNNDTVLTITRSTEHSGYSNYIFDLVDLDKIDHVENMTFLGISYDDFDDYIPVNYNPID